LKAGLELLYSSIRVEYRSAAANMSSPGVEAMAGGIGSLVALCATYPLKTA
jgi:hypothetical protein